MRQPLRAAGQRIHRCARGGESPPSPGSTAAAQRGAPLTELHRHQRPDASCLGACPHPDRLRGRTGRRARAARAEARAARRGRHAHAPRGGHRDRKAGEAGGGRRAARAASAAPQPGRLAHRAGPVPGGARHARAAAARRAGGARGGARASARPGARGVSICYEAGSAGLGRPPGRSGRSASGVGEPAWLGGSLGLDSCLPGLTQPMGHDPYGNHLLAAHTDTGRHTRDRDTAPCPWWVCWGALAV